MPLTTITMREGRTQEEKKAILDGVHGALRTAFGIPEHDRTQIIHEVSGENWDVAGFPDRIIVEIKAFSGRSLNAKRILYKEIVNSLGRCDVESKNVFIIVNDLPLENWGIRGGQAACDIDLGFKVDV